MYIFHIFPSFRLPVGRLSFFFFCIGHTALLFIWEHPADAGIETRNSPLCLLLLLSVPFRVKEINFCASSLIEPLSHSLETKHRLM